VQPRLLIRGLIAVAGVLSAARLPAADPADSSCLVAGRNPCVVELRGPHAPSSSPDCATEPWSRYLRFVLPDRFVDANSDGWWETVVEIALDPSKECGGAKLRIHFEDPVGAWSVNVGDSPTNNGYGGDAGTTRYAAEMQIREGLLTVYTAAIPQLGSPRFDAILEWTLPALGGRHVDVEVGDQSLVFDMPGAFAGDRPLHWKLGTPVGGALYSLAPRAGPEGPEAASVKDKGLYAGFNRVIGEAGPGHGRRIGTGVRRVAITLSP
jgi:hypothetical protein